MTAVLAVVVLVAVVGALVLASSAQRRAEEAQVRANALIERNHQLERALGVAEQALRSLASDTRLDAGMAVQIDSAIEDIRRASGEGGSSLDR
jgi:hypothetical protein